VENRIEDLENRAIEQYRNHRFTTEPPIHKNDKI
jgi:hypothetical protein